LPELHNFDRDAFAAAVERHTRRAAEARQHALADLERCTTDAAGIADARAALIAARQRNRRRT
jgi:hypothetical protein